MRNARFGFTLVELLVVVAIISIVAGLLFAGILGARQSAYGATCSSNLKQLGLALAQYVGDNDERLMPCQVLGSGVSATTVGWAGILYPYAPHPGVYVCPTDDTPVAILGGDTYYPVTYFLNLDLVAPNVTGGISQSQFTAPASTILMTESTGGGLSRVQVRLRNPNEMESDAANEFLQSAGTPFNRHRGGRMFLLADYHVKWLVPTAVSQGTPPSPLSTVVAAPPTQMPNGVVATFMYQ